MSGMLLFIMKIIRCGFHGVVCSDVRHNSKKEAAFEGSHGQVGLYLPELLLNGTLTHCNDCLFLLVYDWCHLGGAMLSPGAYLYGLGRVIFLVSDKSNMWKLLSMHILDLSTQHFDISINLNLYMHNCTHVLVHPLYLQENNLAETSYQCQLIIAKD